MVPMMIGRVDMKNIGGGSGLACVPWWVTDWENKGTRKLASDYRWGAHQEEVRGGWRDHLCNKGDE